MNKLRVLIVSHTYTAGINQQKIKCLAKLQGLEVGLVAPEFWCDRLRATELEKREDSDYQIFPLRAYRVGDINRYFYNPWCLFRVIQKFRPQIIHIEEEPFSWALLEINFLAKLMGIRTLFFTWQNLMQKYSHPMRLIEAVNFRLSSLAIAGNQEAEAVLRKRGFKKEVRVLCQLGVDPRTFHPGPEPELRKTLGFQPDDLVIGFVGRFAEEKGVMTLLKAFSQVRKDKVQLLLLGGGDLLDQIRDYIDKNKLSQRVRIVSAVPHHEVPKYLRLMDILVLPSETREFWAEQFGHVLIEAMASEAAVVGSSSGAIPEVIGKAGLIFPEGNVGRLAEKLTLLLKDSNLRRCLVERGRHRVLAHFTHEAVARQTLEIYQTMREVS